MALLLSMQFLTDYTTNIYFSIMTSIQFKVAKTTTERRTKIHYLLLLQAVIQTGNVILFVANGFAVEYANLSILYYKYLSLNYDFNTIWSC